MKVFMVKCNKCSIEKLDNEYYTYYHSTQQRWRTRKICNSCMNESKRLYKETIKTKKIMEPVVLELEIEVVNPLSTNPDYRLCRTCQEYVHLDGFYKYKARGITFKEYLDCKKCCNKKESTKRKQERQEWKENTGGSDRISNDVGVFQDTYQKDQCYLVMEALGYTYSEECGHFLKPGVKEYVDGELKFYKVNSKKFPSGQKIDYNRPEWREIFDLYKTGKFTLKQISKKYNVSAPTISKFVNRMKNG